MLMQSIGFVEFVVPVPNLISELTLLLVNSSICFALLNILNEKINDDVYI